MKKILTVSFVALISVISAGNAAIPDKTYVDDTVDTAVASKVDVAQDVANAFMVTDESGNVVASTEVAESLGELAAAVESAMDDIETLENADATNLQAAKDYANSLASKYDAAGAAATAQTNAVEYTDGQIAALAETYETKEYVSQAVQEAKDYASDEAAAAETSAKSYAVEELLKKVDKTGHTASQVVITDSTGTITTAAQIANTQVSGLGALATKSTIADADVAADAAIAQSKIAGLTDALAAKVDDSQVVATGGTVTSSDAQIPTIARVDAAVATKVDIAQGAANKNAIMITNAAGNVIPAPVGDCANTENKCALVTGVDESGNLALQWEVIARNVPQPSAEE